MHHICRQIRDLPLFQSKHWESNGVGGVGTFEIGSVKGRRFVVEF